MISLLLLYNTLARKKQKFKSISGKKVGFYSCGPTVYSYAHIGNLRPYIISDLLKRVLKLNSYEVNHVMNITDVGHLFGDGSIGEDKVRSAAEREHKSEHEIAKFYTEAFIKDLELLNVPLPDVMPRASEHIEKMLDLVDILDKKGYLYKVKTGLYFDTSKFKAYGKLSGMTFKKLNKFLKAGARVERAAGLKNVTDFAVWRFLDKEGEMIWDSKFGRGFPGWHIECSAMSMHYLGEQLDIHSGGVDHIPIHHTNEIAQSESATGKNFVNYWVHNQFLNVNGTKISKSLGNVYLLSDLIKRDFSPMTFKYFILSAHYRSKINFTFEALSNAQKTLFGIYSFMERLSEIQRDVEAQNHKEFVVGVRKMEKDFYAALNNDLNTPVALSVLHALISATNKRREAGMLSKGEANLIVKKMLEFDKLLGLDFETHLNISKEIPDEVERLVAEREDARKNKDFTKADSIRKMLKEKYHILLEDTKDGVKWHKE